MERALPVLDRACERHGGVEAWRALNRIDGDVVQASGAIPLLKGAAQGRCRMERVIVEPHASRATIRFRSGQELTFDRGDVIDGEARHTAFRRNFSGLFKKLRPWGPRETAYFFGYALTHYLSLPFSLHPDVDTPRPVTLRGVGSRRGLDWIEAEYPRGSDTHSRRERFWFDATGLLVRHDYHAEIMGPGFHGAHHSSDYTVKDGVLVAQRRRVTFRLGKWSTPVPVLDARIRLRTDRTR